MRNRKFLIGALVGVIGALAFSGVASAAPISQSLETTVTPAKQDKKVFGGASLHNIIGTTIDNPATTQSPQQTVFTIDRNVKFVNGNDPPCPLSAVQGKFTAQAQAACPQSITGGGSVEVNGGAVKGTVMTFSGGPKTIYVQTDIGPGATTLTIIGTIFHRTLTFSNIPNTPGLDPYEVRRHVQQAQDGQDEGQGQWQEEEGADLLLHGALQGKGLDDH